MIVLVLPDIAAEDELLRRAHQGDQQAVMEMYERYFQPIYQYIRLRTDDAALAEDLAANVFLKLVTTFKRGAASNRIPPIRSLRGWLFQVARSELHQHYGRNPRYATSTLEEWEPIAAADFDLESDYLRRTTAERARRALRMLAPDQQEVLILRFGQALNLEDTAQVMGKSISAIKSLQSRAVNTLRAILGDAGEGGV
ncbi:MAG: RNA polymerase sigma factor [Anaerolineae bacterium]